MRQSLALRLQPQSGCAKDAGLLGRRDAIAGAAVVAALAQAYFHEDDDCAVLGDQVDFAALATEVSREDLQALAK